MFVTEHIDRAQRPLFSYEIIPPPRGQSVGDVLSMVEDLVPFEPPFIDVTSHSAEAYYEELGDGTVKRRIRKKHPGTISICGIIQNRYNVDTVAHLLCRGFTREETEDVLIELNYLGIHNVLAIRGDESNYRKPIESDRTSNVYAAELVGQLNDLKNGRYLDELANSEPMEFCVGVGGYPEKHIESPNLKADVRYLKDKVDAGADYVVTQMFYDNRFYFKFVKECRAAGIEVPIIPGIKLIGKKDQLASIPKKYHVSIPEELCAEIEESPAHVREISINWAVSQCRELLECGTRCVHFYVLNDSDAITDVIKQLD